MKLLQPIAFDPGQCRKELDAFRDLLAAKVELSESGDIQPLFKASPQLAALVGTQVTGIDFADRFAFEFDVFGNYTADLVIGSSDTSTFCAIEFEDARENSIFHKVASRAQKEWGRRFEHGFGQLIDWFHAFDDHKNSAEFAKHFGFGHAVFYGVLIIGRSAHLTDYDRARLRWRSDRVTVNTHKVSCLTYDELLAALLRQWQWLELMRQKPEGSP
jgi:hypothetical protein